MCGQCGDFSILDSFGLRGLAVEPRQGFGLAVDLGTTSVVLVLFDLLTGAAVSRHGFMNPQRIYGPDVISRISAANDGHLDKLHCLITESLSAGITALLTSQNLPPDSVADMVVAGNTTMAHLLLGLSCESLGVFPFKPAHELPGNDGAMRVVPWLSGFVGGDITAGLLSVLTEGKRCFVLIDLGTNGEIALYNDGSLTVTSVAAGPAFEGAKGGTASGLLDDLALLVREGLVDKKGRLRENSTLFTQREIHDLQLAKSAVRTGFEVVLESANLSIRELDAVYLAGGIGQAMKVSGAVAVGLLPETIEDRVQAVGNASLSGAARLLLPRRDQGTRWKGCVGRGKSILRNTPVFMNCLYRICFFDGESGRKIYILICPTGGGDAR
ncbi:MAG: ASKHA domain-containing protein [Gracilibacteraceae bacterium]|nr:ASKHA domain-containing protein [Gracilibacteraceae bacterium]